MTRTRDDDAIGVPLFPCLAVMLCTMGALIVLLVVVARYASLSPAAAVVPAAMPEPDAAPDARWAQRIHELQQADTSLAATLVQRQQALAAKRDELAFIEADSRQVQDQIRQWQQTLAAHEKLQSANDQQHRAAADELAKLRDDIAAAQTEVKDLEQEHRQRPAVYSIVPYEGPYQTRRRPIYLECRSDKIVLQPEGLEFTPEDAVGGFQSTNPLAAVLRATREYHSQTGVAANDKNAYPLLLVRPDGTASYAAVRTLLQQSNIEFGYELIDQNWKLNFPTAADPALAKVQQQALAEARVLHEAAQEFVARKQVKRKSYVVSPTGSVVEDRSGSALGVPGIPYENARPRGGDRSGSEFGNPPRNTVATTPADRAGATGRNGLSTDGRDDTNSATLTFSANSTRTTRSSANGANRRGSGDAGGSGDNDGGDGVTMPGSPSPGEHTPAGAPRLGEYAGARPEPRRPARDEPSEAAGGPGAAGSAGATSAARNAANASSTMSATVDAAVDASAESLANKRGENWALRNAARGSIPITRPIRVVCHADRLDVLAADDRDAPKSIALPPRTRDSVDPLVTAVWDHARAWGIAGKGMYWRPVLTFYIQPGGQARFDELTRLLDGSGFDIRYRTASGTIVAPPAR